VSDDPGGPGTPADPDDPAADLTLAEVLAAAAEDLDGVTGDGDESAMTWSAGGHAFAALAGDWAEFRLDPAVARAALRTPDAAASPRGPGWVSFAPAVLDDQAIDRAEAWFLSAHRHATAVRY
jgi:hypothetical protein